MRVIVRDGYADATMQAVATEAHASKETLYSWFGDREALVTAVIRLNADESAISVTERLNQPVNNAHDARTTLVAYARGLLTLLCSPTSLALNRAAMTSTRLAAELLESGRHRVGPLVAAYLTQLHSAGYIVHSDGEEAFAVLFGLVVQDTQIRVLLGEAPPSADTIDARAQWAVDVFMSPAMMHAIADPR